ncbi:hypothetical protein GQ607_017095 [Colletotrichum asianum]|uniref:Uncharacterized protein n=1 Tax=Colletotrichum asianum TaxID=702518 RepID=A0A8H3VUK3_9PEZI|nr:hypothetical protein GQ607_017095 [Colletotrichum asianum]
MFLNQPFPFVIQKTLRSPQIKPENVEETIYGNNLSHKYSIVKQDARFRHQSHHDLQAAFQTVRGSPFPFLPGFPIAPSHRMLLYPVQALEPQLVLYPILHGLPHPDGSGKASAISEDAGRALLDDLERRTIEAGGEGHAEGPDMEDHLRAMPSPPSAVILGPNDSTSVACRPVARRRGVPHPHSPPPRTVAQIEVNLVAGAWLLFELSTSIDRRLHGGCDSDRRNEDEHAPGSFETRRQRHNRWKLVQMLIDVEMELNACGSESSSARVPAPCSMTMAAITACCVGS